MPIAFSQIPSSWRLPLYWAELDSSMAGYSTPRQPALLVGTMLPAGTAEPDIAVPIASQAQADQNFGIGSELSRMFKAFFKNNFSNECWGLGVVASAASVAATATIVVDTKPTDAGTIHLYIGDEHVPVNIAPTDTEEEIANAIAEAINDNEALPVTAEWDDSGLPFNRNQPRAAGAPDVGVALHVDEGDWGNGPITGTAYQWKRSDALTGGTVTPIAGETTADYTLQIGDEGDYILATVTATNAVGSTDADSNVVGPVTSVVTPPVPSAPQPAITGTPMVGEELSCSSGTWTGSPADYTYQWHHGPIGTGAAIGGATNPTLTLEDTDETQTIYCIVTATNTAAPAGVTANSNLTTEVQPASPLDAPVIITNPQITGDTARGGGRGQTRAGTGRAMAPADIVLTCKWPGSSGNEIVVSMNYAGAVGGQITPPGLGITLPPTGRLSGGTGVPLFVNAISNLGETAVEYVAMPYTDAASLNIWETEFGFSDAGRWGFMRQLYGGIFSARRGTYAELITFGSSRNGAQTSVMGVEPASPTPAYEWAAAYTAKAQRALTNDPARPLQTLVLDGVLLAPPDGRFIMSEINTLATYGIATQMKSANDVNPMISRESTTYRLNLFSFEDDAYELVTTLSTLSALLRNQRSVITTKFARCKLANDGTRFGPGQRVATPGIVKAELVSNYRGDMFNGLVEDIANFKKNLIVERDVNNPNRLNILYPPDLINQLRIFAVVCQFRLQYDRDLDTLVAA
jgi:phage tail sheath gpL-like